MTVPRSPAPARDGLDALAAFRPAGRALTLDETLSLMAPAEGPQDSLPASVDVLIVGAGPAGLTAANLLGSLGVDCLLMEQKAATSDTPKAIAVDDEYMRVLDRLELSGLLEPHLSAPFGVHFLSPFGFALVKVPGFVTPNGFGNRNAVLQPVFEKVLLEGCRRFPSVRLRFGAPLSAVLHDDRQVTATFETASGPCKVTARYALACDGARSFVRTALQIPFPGSRIDEPHLVVDLADFPDHANHSRFFCNPTRPVNSIPAPYGGRRLEFMLSPGDDRQRIVSDVGIRELVDRHTPYRGVPLNIIRRTIYGFSERVAGRLNDGRVFRVGDAAHVMPPFGGQGMNTGARDAANLCWKLAAVLRRQAGPETLASYDAERREHIAATVDYSVRVGRLANIRSRWRSVVRDAAFTAAGTLPGVRRYFREMRHLPRPFIRDGLVVRAPGGDDGITGRLLPRLALAGSGGRPVSVDGAAGPWFALIGLAVDAARVKDASRHPLWRRLAPGLVALTSRPASHAAPDTVPDGDRPATFSVADDHGRALLDGHPGTILVLRPDRVVAGFATVDDFAGFSDRLAARLGCATEPGGTEIAGDRQATAY